jgi:hypothetical protein
MKMKYSVLLGALAATLALGGCGKYCRWDDNDDAASHVAQHYPSER